MKVQENNYENNQEFNCHHNADDQLWQKHSKFQPSWRHSTTAQKRTELSDGNISNTIATQAALQTTITLWQLMAFSNLSRITKELSSER